jgi:hypothetical protein
MLSIVNYILLVVVLICASVSYAIGSPYSYGGDVNKVASFDRIGGYGQERRVKHVEPLQHDDASKPNYPRFIQSDNFKTLVRSTYGDSFKPVVRSNYGGSLRTIGNLNKHVRLNKGSYQY